MKPFNLEEYLNNPSKKVVTRDGIKARVVCTDRKSESFPIIALVDSDKKAEKVYSFAKNGKFSDGGVHNLDLFFAPEKHEGWATIYGKFLTGEIFSTKEEAEESVKRCGKKDFIAIAKVEWEE